MTNRSCWLKWFTNQFFGFHYHKDLEIPYASRSGRTSGQQRRGAQTRRGGPAPPRLSGNGSGRASPREPGGSDGGGGAGPTAAQRGRGGRRAVLWAPGLERGRSPAGAEPLNPRRALPGRAGCDGKARRF